MSLNFIDVFDNRLYSQYFNQPRIEQWLKILGNLSEVQLKEAYDQMTYNIDKARGEQLDFIGKIVGIDRALQYDVDEFFGYEGTTGAVGYGVAPYLDFDGAALVKIPDNLYRIAIRAKIAKNVSVCTPDQVILNAQFVTGQEVELIDNEDMSFSLNTDAGTLDPALERLLQFYELEIRPAGVEFLGYNV